jgi:imidazolonepropionase-like amidohydrolase
VTILILFKNGKCWYEGEFKKLDILVQDGRIKEIASGINPDETMEQIDMDQKTIYPGFIDPHTHVGVFEEKAGGFAGNDVNETSSPVTAGVRALDGLNPLDPGIMEARNAGYTTVCVLPGSANVIGGEGVVIKTAGTVADEMVVKTPKKIVKMAFGRNPQWHWGGRKTLYTRLQVAALVRDNLNKAKDYMNKEEKEYDYNMEVLSGLLKKESVARVHVANLEDIETIKRIMEEYDILYTLDHATALHTDKEVAESLKDVPVILGPLNVAGKSYQTYDLTFKSVQILNELGFKLSMMTDAPVIPLNYGIIQMWLIDKLRMDRKNILDMFTINPAKVLGLEDEIGSLEKGKYADFAVTDGDIFDVNTSIRDTYIAGVSVGGES